jgi:hypothetical protein
MDPKVEKVTEGGEEAGQGFNVILGDIIAIGASLFSILVFVYNREA